MKPQPMLDMMVVTMQTTTSRNGISINMLVCGMNAFPAQFMNRKVNIYQAICHLRGKSCLNLLAPDERTASKLQHAVIKSDQGPGHIAAAE